MAFKIFTGGSLFFFFLTASSCAGIGTATGADPEVGADPRIATTKSGLNIPGFEGACSIAELTDSASSGDNFDVKDIRDSQG
jgi:hypothetical protein